MIRLLALAAALALASSAFTADPEPMPKVPPDLAIVPQDAVAVFSICVAALSADAKLKTLMPHIPGGPQDTLDKSLRVMYGFRSEDLERVTFVRRRDSERAPVVIFHWRKGPDLGALRKLLGKVADVTVHGKKAFFCPDLGVWPAGEKTTVTGDGPDLAAFLAALRHKGKGPHPLADAFAEIAGGKHGFVAGVLPSACVRTLAAENSGEAKERKRIEGDHPEYTPERELDLRPLDTSIELLAREAPGDVRPIITGGGPARLLLVTATLSAGSVTAKARARFDTEKEAEAGLKAVAALLGLTKDGLAGVMKNLPDEAPLAKAAGPLVGRLGDAIAAAKPKRDGKTITAELTLKFDIAPLLKAVEGKEPG